MTEKAERYDEFVECLEKEASLTGETELVLGLLHRAGTILDERVGDANAAKQRFLRALEIDPAFVPALASLGRIYYRCGHWDDLLEMYRRELDATPETSARVALATKMGELCERQRGKPAEALEHYRQAVELAPGYRPAVRALERLLREAGEYGELVALLGKHLPELRDPAARALTAYRIGELHEERLDNPRQAIEAYQQALAEVPDHRPAAVAIGRLLEETRDFDKLALHLVAEAEAAADARRKATLLLRLGEIRRDHLGDEAAAVAAFEAAFSIGEGAEIPALLALEPLYAGARDLAALAGVHRRQAAAFTDPAARLAALRELARVQAATGAGPEECARTHEAILGIAADDTEALSALGEIARALDDAGALVRAHARLAGAEPDPGISAQHWLAVGRLTEGVDAGAAMEAYRAALAKAPDSLAAIRGVGRLAEATGDAGAVAEALRREALVTIDAQGAADLLVRAAAVGLVAQGAAAAAEDLTRALELWPDHEEAAESLCRVLVEAGRAERLVDVLTQAAAAARTPVRQAALWLAVAKVYADHRQDPGAAVAALRRALRLQPGYLEAHRALGRAYVKNAQWSEAIAARETLIGLDLQADERAALHLEIAALFDDRLSNPEQGARCAGCRPRAVAEAPRGARAPGPHRAARPRARPGRGGDRAPARERDRGRRPRGRAGARRAARARQGRRGRHRAPALRGGGDRGAGGGSRGGVPQSERRRPELGGIRGRAARRTCSAPGAAAIPRPRTSCWPTPTPRAWACRARRSRSSKMGCRTRFRTAIRAPIGAAARPRPSRSAWRRRWSSAPRRAACSRRRPPPCARCCAGGRANPSSGARSSAPTSNSAAPPRRASRARRWWC